MRRSVIASVCLAVLIAACQAGPTYVGVGDVVAVDGTAGQATVRHDEIAGLRGAGTSQFAVASGDVLAALIPGTRVRFELRRRGDQLVVTRAAPLAAGNPGIHDHTPHHGGVVAMVGMIHLEAKASPSGRVQLYLTDIWRRPLPLDGVSGSVTLDLPDGKRPLPLTVGPEALEATGAPLGGRSVNAAFAVRYADGAAEVSFLLPLSAQDSGAAGIPAVGCVASPRDASGARAPRCTLTFEKPVAAVAAAPDGTTLLVAQVDYGVSAWRLPAGEFAAGFAPPPPLAMPIAEPPHPEAPNALLVRADGREAVVAIENRLVRYAMDSGQVLRAFEGPGGIVRAAAWSPDGERFLVSAFYNRQAALLAAVDGQTLQRFAVEREAAAVAFAPDGHTVAVGSETGPVAIFASDAATPLRVLQGPRGPVRAMAFVAAQLIAAGDDGVLRIWESDTGQLRLALPLGPTLRAMAVDPTRGLIAAVGLEPRIQVINLADGRPVATLEWHSAQVLALTWAQHTLVSGDVAGHVALWDVEAHASD